MPAQDHLITVEDAVTMTSLYRDNKLAILDSEYRTEDRLPLCETFDKEAFEDLMQNHDCKALRIYYGMDENLKVHAIIVGVNENDEDILVSGGLEVNLIERSRRCPPKCPPTSVLNSNPE